jgi:SAM-dependent methyltransferase
MSLMNISRIVNICFGAVGLQVSRLDKTTVQPAPRECLLPKEEEDMYLTTYGEDVFERRPFLNVGAGDFRHPAWRNLDFYTDAYASDVRSNMDIEMDLSKMERWPIPDNSIEAIFTSHTIEHLRDDHDQHIFEESFRVLKPGGVIRVTCPDIELYFRAMRHGDRHFFLNYAPTWIHEDIEQLFLREFATQISTANNDGLPISKVTSKEIKDVFDSMDMEDGLNEFGRRIDYYKWYKLVPGNHVNWWSYEKLFRFLSGAGFGEMYRSGFGQSLCRPMRSPLFDWTAKNISLYAEAFKPLSNDTKVQTANL